MFSGLREGCITTEETLEQTSEVESPRNELGMIRVGA